MFRGTYFRNISAILIFQKDIPCHKFLIFASALYRRRNGMGGGWCLGESIAPLKEKTTM